MERGRRCYAVGVFDPPPLPQAGAGRAESLFPNPPASISAYFCLPISAFLFLPSMLSVSEAYLKTSACPFSEVRLWSLSREAFQKKSSKETKPTHTAGPTIFD